MIYSVLPCILLHTDYSVIKSPSHAGQQNTISSPNCLREANDDWSCDPGVVPPPPPDSDPRLVLPPSCTLFNGLEGARAVVAGPMRALSADKDT